MPASTWALRRRTRSGLSRGDARLLARVAPQVEQQLVVVGAEAADVLLVLRAHAVGHEAAVADLGERRTRRLVALERALQRPAGEIGRERHLHRLEHGGRHVDALHLARDARARAAVAGELHDQRDADELVEQAPAVEPEPVVLELLAVVGQEHDERVVVEAQRLELAHEAAELAGRRRRRPRRTARSCARGRAAPCSRCAGRARGARRVACGSNMRSKGAGGA